MQCPYCQTENREDRETCYVCGGDISTLRLVVNKARQHYNNALEHAERGRNTEAIDELRNALDLDGSFVGAHVVLGTLYAKIGEFDKARASWRQALDLQPELERAHEYLQRVDGVQAALPTLRLYRWVTRCLLILMVLLAAGIAYMLRSKPYVENLRRASEYYEGQKYGKALKTLENVEKQAEADSPVQVGAIALDAAIRSDLKQQVRRIQDLKYREMYPEALDAIADVEAKEPDNQTSAAVAAIRDDINRYYRDRIDQLFDAFQQGSVSLASLEQQVEQFRNLYPDSAGRDELNQYLVKARELEAENEVQGVRDQFIRTHDFQAAIADLRELSQKFPGNEAFSKSRSLLVEDILSYMFNLYTDLLDQHDFPLALQLLGEIEDIATEFRDVINVEISSAVNLARSVFQSTRRSAIIDEIEQMVRDGRLETAEVALWYFGFDPGLTDAEFAVLDSLEKRIALQKKLKPLHKELGDLKEYLSGDISDKRASRTLGLYHRLNKAGLGKDDRADLLLLSGAAAWKLERKDLASSISRSLQSVDSSGTRTAALKKLTGLPETPPDVKKGGERSGNEVEKPGDGDTKDQKNKQTDEKDAKEE